MISANYIGLMIIMVGLYGLMTKKNLIKQILCVDIALVGLMVFFSGIAYIKGGSIPIYRGENVVNPLPHALILPSLVVEVALTALALIIILKIKGKEE